LPDKNATCTPNEPPGVQSAALRFSALDRNPLFDLKPPLSAHWHTPCEQPLSMKTKYLAVSILSGALLAVPFAARADDNDKNLKDKANDKAAEAQRKTHESICQGHHGQVTAKSTDSITIDGKRYALTADTGVNKQEEPLLPKTVKVGDTVCFVTQQAADGSQQISKLIAIDKDTEKVRVREKDSDTDSPSKVEVETPNKKIEVK
jgi:hypothetical protein